MATDPGTGLPEVLGQMIYEQGKVIIDGAIAEAVAAEQERIRTAAREASFTLFRPGNGPAQGLSMAVVPLGELLAILGEEGTGA